MALSDITKDRLTYGMAKLVSSVLSLPGVGFHNGVVRNLRPILMESKSSSIKLDVPGLVQPHADDRILFERIFKAFKKAKEDQLTADQVYLPSSMWQEQLEISYQPLFETLKMGDIEPLAYFLSNFGRWKEYIGIESGSILVRASEHPALHDSIISRFGLLLEWWTQAEQNDRSLDVLSYPRHGNQCGFIYNDKFTGIGSPSNDFYGRLIANILPDNNPRILEVGGGYGKLFYFVQRHLKDNNFKYIDVDLPEVLCCCAYYMLKTFPDKKVVLYGEYDDLHEAIEDADIVLLPGWEVEKLPEKTADIFINKNSLGEMSPETARAFIRQCSSRVNHIWHSNHEFMRNEFDGGNVSLINKEYPIPSEFKLKHRYVESTGIIYSGDLSDIYNYQYSR